MTTLLLGKVDVAPLASQLSVQPILLRALGEQQPQGLASSSQSMEKTYIGEVAPSLRQVPRQLVVSLFQKHPV